MLTYKMKIPVFLKMDNACLGAGFANACILEAKGRHNL
jgi:hypothetical protein